MRVPFLDRFSIMEPTTAQSVQGRRKFSGIVSAEGQRPLAGGFRARRGVEFRQGVEQARDGALAEAGGGHRRWDCLP
jgi:hypothetical protein